MATWIRQLWSQGAVAEAGKESENTTASNKAFIGLVLAVLSLLNGLGIGWIIAVIAKAEGAGGGALITALGGMGLGMLGIVFALMGFAEVNASPRSMYGRETGGLAIGLAVVGAVLSGLQSLIYFN